MVRTKPAKRLIEPSVAPSPATYEEEAHLGLKLSAVASCTVHCKRVCDVTSAKRPAKKAGQPSLLRKDATECWDIYTHMIIEAIRGESETSPVWEGVKP